MKQMRLRFGLIGLLLIPACSFGVSKEIVELQRDLATLQDQVRTLQSSTTEKLTALTVLVQQTLDATSNTKQAVAAMESRVNTVLKEQSNSVGPSLAVQGAKIDQLSSDF